MITVNTALNRIINGNSSDYVKMCKLWRLGAKQIPGSETQKIVASIWREYYDKVHGKV